MGKIASTLTLLVVVATMGCGARTFLDDDGAGGSPEPVPTPPATTNECVEACRGAEPLGAELFIATGGGCLCQDCSESCMQTVCELAELPSDECLTCVQTSVFGDWCQNHAGLFGVCLESNTECGTFTQCLLACEP